MVTIHGQVSDFSGHAIAGATVELKDQQFSTVATDTSDSSGRYHIEVPAGNYMALAACKDYQTKNLEYWAWNVPAESDLEINPRFDRLEVYAMNAWRPQGAYPSYQVYFRPMSLSKVAAAYAAAGSMEALGKLPVLDIAPELKADDIQVTIDDVKVKVLEVNGVRESSGRDQYMFGYLIQTSLPEAKPKHGHTVIDIVLTDSATGEKGEGCLFVRERD